MVDKPQYVVKYIEELKAYKITSPDVRGLCVIEPTIKEARRKAQGVAKIIIKHRRAREAAAASDRLRG